MDAELQSHIQQEVRNVFTASQNNIMMEMKTIISSEIGKVTSKQQDLADAQIAKLERTITDSYKFNRKGNEEQFKHNQKVMNKVRSRCESERRYYDDRNRRQSQN